MARHAGLFLVSFIIAGIIMAFGQSGARTTRSIFDRVAGIGRGEAFARLSTATIRAVALGVLGVALIQAIVVGLILMIADSLPSTSLIRRPPFPEDPAMLHSRTAFLVHSEEGVWPTSHR